MKLKRDCYSDFHWSPLTGLLDNRSNPDGMPPYSFRQIQNWWVPDAGRLKRRPGWDKLFSRSPYNNQDLHDQLLALQTFYGTDVGSETDAAKITTYPNALCDGDIQTLDIGRQPLTLGLEMISTLGGRKLLIGTESRLYTLNENTGNYKIIGDGYGEGIDDGTCPRTRFYAAQNQDIVVLTNNYDKPLYHMFGAMTMGCGMQAVHEIPDLALIQLTKAAHVWSWKGVSFLADVEMGGQRYQHRIVWSDFENPLGWDPSDPESITGFQDLEFGEKIMGGMELGPVFLVYTNRRVWQLTAVGGDMIFVPDKRYTSAMTGKACLAYRNTLISVGDAHFYAGSDGIYKYDLYSPKPERIEWIHRGTGQMFDRTTGINPECCDNHVAGYNSNTNEIWFSYADRSSTTCCPNKTLVVNIGEHTQHVSTVDHGFTMFVLYHPYPIGTIRDFILENCICTNAELNTLGYGFIKEGLPLEDDEEPDCDPITSIYTDEELVVDGVTIEDYTQETFSEGSLCELIGDERIDADCFECDTEAVFIMASSTDWCLKQSSLNLNRERCTNPTAVGTSGDDGYTSSEGTYALDGYDSILVPAPLSFGYPTQDKILGSLDGNAFEVEATPTESIEPAELQLRVGMSVQIVDTLNENCALLWSEEEPINLACQGPSLEDHIASGTSPDEVIAWPLHMQGRWLYWELKISGTGGDCCLTRVTHRVKLAC